jgi:integrase
MRGPKWSESRAFEEDLELSEKDFEFPKRGWDAGLDFIETYRKILSHLHRARKPQDVVLLIQLRNGSRVGEAVEALRKFCETGKTQVLVKIEKHRDPRDQRLMVLPEELRKGQGRVLLEQACAWLSGVEKPKEAVKSYCRRAYGFNTHSLRYAFITYLSRKGVPPQIIAKITFHKDMSHILTYTQKRTAEEMLRDLWEL